MRPAVIPVAKGESGTKAERLFIPGPAGQMEAILEYDAEREPRAAAVVCHPHPLFGGTMHSKVVYRAAKAALAAGFAALRFNFRGVGASAGEHDDGVGEQDDVRAALDYLSARFPCRPTCMIGYSFGCAVGLAVGSADSRVSALAGIGVPTTVWDMSFLQSVSKRTLFIQGTQDAFGPRDAVETLYASLAGDKRLCWIEGADHSFNTRLDELEAAAQAFLAEIV